MIIGITGLSNSGKDTVGAYLIKEHNFSRRAFADPGKKHIAEALDIPLWEIENWKNDDTVFVTVGNKNEPKQEVTEFIKANMPSGFGAGFQFVPPNHMWSPIREQTFREFTQSFFESAKKVFGEDVWVNRTLPVGGFYDGQAIVVTDVRFQNEAERIKELDGFIIKVERPDIEQGHHRSETEQLLITPHYRLVNDSTVEKLYIEVERMLEHLTSE